MSSSGERVRCPDCGGALAGGEGSWQCSRCGARTDHNPAVPGDERLRVFLSYGHDTNAELVGRIKGFLEARGHEVWIDKDEVKGGDDWRRAIHDGIAASDQVLSVLSKHSVRDPGVCLDEIAIALSVRGGNVSTVLVEPEDAVAVPPSVGHVQWLDMSDWRARRDQPGYEDWLAGKLGELAAVVESEQSRRFAGEIDRLNRVLRPVLPHARTAVLLDRFVGRQWLADEVEVWRADPDARALCLLGAPGVGKSAFTARLQHYWGDRVMAAHFCQWDKPEHRDAAVVVRSLAFQVACRLPQYRRRLLDLPQLDDLAGYTADDLFHLLLADPLQVAIDGGQQHLILAVDAVDEARTPDGDNPLLRVLARNAAELPSWVRVLLTARPDSDVVPAVAHLNPVVIDGARRENLADITAYLQDRLDPFLTLGPDPGGLLDRIVENSGGVFLYARYFCDAVECGDLDLNTPEAFPRGLGGIYHQDLIRRFGPDGLQAGSDAYHAAAIVLASAQPVPLSVLAGALGLTSKRLNAIADRFGSHLDAEGGIARFAHKSMHDYLQGLDPSTQQPLAGRFWVESAEGHSLLGDHCLKLLLCAEPDALVEYPLRWAELHLRIAGRGKDADRAAQRIRELLADPVWVVGGAARLGVDVLTALYDRYDTTTILARLVSTHAHVLRNQCCDRTAMVTTLAWAALRFDQPDLTATFQGLALGGETPRLVPLWTTERIHPALIRSLSGHSSAVTTVAFGALPDGRTILATASKNDDDVRLWEPATGRLLHTFTGSTIGVTSVAIGTASGRTLVAACNDRVVRVWDATAGTLMRTLTFHTGMRSPVFGVLPDGSPILATGTTEGIVPVWAPTTGELLHTISGHADGVTSVALWTLVDGSCVLATASRADWTVRLWDPATGTRLHTLIGHAGGVWATAFGKLRDGRDLLATGSADRTVRLWQPASGKPLQLLTDHRCASAANSGERASGKPLQLLTDHTHGVTSITLGRLPDGRTLLATANRDDNTVQLWDPGSGTLNDTQIPNTYAMTSMALGRLPDGRTLLATANRDDNTVQLWDPATGQIQNPIAGGTTRLVSVAFGVLPDRGAVLAVGSQGGTVHVLDPATGIPGRTLLAHKGPVRGMEFGTVAGRTILATASGGTVRLWDLETGLVQQTFDGHTGPVCSMAFGTLADGRSILATISGEGNVRVFDPASGDLLRVLPGRTNSVVLAVLPDGTRILAHGGGPHVWLSDPASGRLLRTLVGHTGSVTLIAFAALPDGGTLLATTGLDRTVRLWDPATGTQLRILTGHSAPVTSIALANLSDGHTLLATATRTGVQAFAVAR